jgi:hypothetical protein
MGIGYLTANSRRDAVGSHAFYNVELAHGGFTAHPARESASCRDEAGRPIGHPPYLAVPQAFSATYLGNKAARRAAKLFTDRGHVEKMKNSPPPIVSIKASIGL